MHSYTTPAILVLPVEWVDTDYNAWIMAETKAREIDTTGSSELATDNRLVGSSSPPSPTTQSPTNRDFPVQCE
jgi:hypothetical protein